MSKYYPLRVGRRSSCIVSDTDPQRPTYNVDTKRYEIDHYGGYVIAESLPPGVAQQMVDAYNEKYGCTNRLHPCIGGKMCCQSKISHHLWVEQEKTLKSAHSFTEDMDVEWNADKIQDHMRKQPIVIRRTGLSEELKAEIALHLELQLDNVDASERAKSIVNTIEHIFKLLS